MNKIKKIGIVAVLALALTLSSAAPAVAALTLNATTVTGSTTASLVSTTDSAVTVDSGTTGAVNIGNGAAAKTITVGNAASTLLDLNAISVDIDGAATGVTIDAFDAGTINLGTSTDAASDTSDINIGTSDSARTITIGHDTSTKVDVNAAAIELDSGATVDIDAATSLSLNTIAGQDILIGNDVAAQDILIGNASATEVSANAVVVDIDGGATGVTIDALDAGTIDIGVSTTGTSDTSNINIGTSASLRTITIGADESTKVDVNALIIELDSAGTIVLNSTTTTAIGATETIDIQATTGLTLDSTGATAITIGGDTDTGAIDIGTAGARIVTIGNVAVTQLNLVTDGDGANAVNITGTVTTSKGITVTTGNIDVTAGDINLGSSGNAGTVDVFPGTASKGKLAITAADSAGDYTTTIVNASQAAARTYTIPDAGAAADFCLLTTSQAVAGTLTRADLTEEALAVYGIPLNNVRQEDGISLVATETAGTLSITVSSNVWSLKSMTPVGATELSEAVFQFVVPPEYVAAGDVKIRIKNRCVLGSGTNNGSTLDVEVFEQDGNGAIGSDIGATDAVTYAAISAWQTSDFTVTGTNIVAGDILNVVITTNMIESGSANPIHAELDGVAVLLDIKG